MNNEKIKTLIDYVKLDEALSYSIQCHKFQSRKNGIPFICHPIDVLNTLIKFGVTDNLSLMAAIGHDILEDCDSINTIEFAKVFGLATDIIKELTHTKEESKQQYIESFKNKTSRAIVVKIADRICNTLDFRIADKRYAPKYWKKAQPVFDTFVDREYEIKQIFGNNVYQSIQTSIENVKAIL